MVCPPAGEVIGAPQHTLMDDAGARPATAGAGAISPDTASAPFAGLHVAVVVAHPDDEVLGLGGQFATMRHVTVIHTTDGSFSRRDARAHGFGSRHAYRMARREELAAALRTAGTPVEQVELGFRDQHLAFYLVDAAFRLADILAKLAPDAIVTHPYEGGHPDHDSTAFAVAAAVRLSGIEAPVWEMTSYNAARGQCVYGEFQDRADAPPISIELNAPQRSAKSSMLACFRSQQDIVARFPVDIERFRRAPRYDFTAPPHAGRLMYESRRRAWHGRYWRRLATQAQTVLETHGRAGTWRRSLPSAAGHLLRTLIWSWWIAV